MAVDERLAQEIAALQSALAGQPDPIRFGDLAQLLARAGRLPEALRAAERSVGMRPDLPEAHRAYGQVLVLSGRLEEAIRSFERACSLRSSDPELFLAIAQALVEAGQLPAAAPYLDKAARFAPGDPRVASLRALLESSAQGGAGQPPLATDEFLADGEELLSPLEGAASPAPAPLDDLDDDYEPPTMYLDNPMMQQPPRPAEQPGALLPSRPAALDEPPTAKLDLGEAEDLSELETRMDSGVGLRAEISNAVNRVAGFPRSDRADEPPTRLAEPAAPELAPWDREPSVRQAPGGGLAAAPDTLAMQPPPEPAPQRAQPATPSSSISYWKVFLVVVPLLLLAIVAGVWVGYRHIRDEQIADLLDQASGAISQDTMAGYTDARDRLQKLLELLPAHGRAQALLALVSARMHDEYGPNLSMREDAERLVGQGTDESALELLTARLHLAARPPPAELLDAIQAAQKRSPTDPRLTALAAESLVRAERFDQARPLLDAALAAFPADVRLLDLRAEVAERTGDLPAAAELAARAQAINGVHVRSLLRLARLRLGLGKDLPRAEEDLGRLLQLPLVTDRHRAQAHRLLAEVAFLAGERTRALSAVTAAASLLPDDADFRLELAQVCLRYFALDEAVTHTARVLELRPEAIEARLMSLAALLPRGKAREALKGLDALVGQKVPAAPFLVLRGEALLLTGNAAGAAADLRQVPEGAAERARACALLGLAQLEGGDGEAARKTLQALLKEQPGEALGHYAMGRYREEINLRKGAVANYQKAVELDPRCFLALTALGWMEYDARRPEQAEAWVTRALQANPFAIDAQFLFGLLKLRGAEPQMALEAFARVLTERPEHAEALVGMAEALLDLGDTDKARVAVAKARKMGWKDAHSLHVEGRVELASGRFYPAVRALQAAAVEDKNDPEILADLGLAQLGARSITAAEKSLRDSLRRKKLLRAQEGLARLLQAKGKWSQAAGAYEAAAALARRQGKPAAEVHRLFMLAARAMSKDGASGDGRWGKARRLFRLASQSLPEDAESLFEVAATFDRQDNLGGARAAYLKVLEGHPDHAPTLFRLGLLEYDDRKEARAKELLTKFLDLQAKGPDAKRAREVLKRIK